MTETKKRPAWSTLPPRYPPSYKHTEGDYFLGYIEELDVWFDPIRKAVAIVAPPHKKLDPDSYHNFDAFLLLRSENLYAEGPLDVHIDLHETCLLYALCAEYGLFEEGKEEEE